jgi:hypothetical protein
MESNRGIDEALLVSFELRLDTLERLLLGRHRRIAGEGPAKSQASWSLPMNSVSVRGKL